MDSCQKLDITVDSATSYVLNEIADRLNMTSSELLASILTRRVAGESPTLHAKTVGRSGLILGQTGGVGDCEPMPVSTGSQDIPVPVVVPAVGGLFGDGEGVER